MLQRKGTRIWLRGAVGIPGAAMQSMGWRGHLGEGTEAWPRVEVGE